jgi:acetolactate synthase-1/2/3 large subunit
VLAGRGASLPNIKEAIVRFADRIDAMLATSLKGRELFQGHDFNIGIFGEWDIDVPIEIALEYFRELRSAPYRR